VKIKGKWGLVTKEEFKERKGMKEKRIKGKGVGKKEEEGNGDERNKKKSKIGGRGPKTKEQRKKTQTVGKEEKKKMKGFHQMVIKLAHFSRIHSILLDGDQNGFSHHQIRLPLLDGK
jgi:hypothetical protein